MSDQNRPPEPIVDQELLGDFVEEAREHLGTISDGLLQMENNSDDPEVVNSVFRALHTIKGVSSFIGLDDINRLSHVGENVLDAVRENSVNPTQEVIDTLLETCDVLSSLVDDALSLEQNEDRKAHIDQLATKLKGILEKPQEAAPEEPAAENTNQTETPDWPAPGTGLSPELVAQFVNENLDNLHELEESLLKLEKQPNNADIVHAVFRPIHSIKGTADYVGLAQIKTLSHHVESILQLVRTDCLEMSSSVSDLIFEGADALRMMIDELQTDNEVDRDLRDLITRIHAVTNGVSDEEQAASQPAKITATENSTLAIFVQSASQHVESIAKQAKKLLEGKDVESSLTTLQRSLATLQNAANYMGQDAFLDPSESLLELIGQIDQEDSDLDESTKQTISSLTEQLERLLEQVQNEIGDPQPTEGETSVSATGANPKKTPPKKAKQSSASSATGKNAGAKSIRVDQEKLDHYINLAGELVIARNTLSHVFLQFQDDHQDDLRLLKSAIEGVDRIAGMIQDNAMAMRMVPVKTVFQRFPRVVRDIAKAQNKKIDLQIFGEETEVDKQVAEALGDPLVHLIRNSADHGVETPEKRREAGKSETGLITLKAGREGNFIVIDIIDDGAGVNVARLKEKAVQNGLLTQEQADNMPREEALNLIFSAGLSTAQKITDVSGRGVGMDVVRTNILNLGGNVSVHSEEGEGSQLRIQLPLTLAVTTALLVKSEEQTYAMPIEVVQETVKILPEEAKSLNGQWALSLRGNIIPIKSLGEILGVESSSETLHTSEQRNRLEVDQTGRIPIVVADVGGQQFGFMVNELLGQQEIVLKPLPGYLAQLPGLGSATVMGDGTIVLILDPATLYESILGAT